MSQLPHDVEAEGCVLAACILNPETLDLLPGLRAEHFYSLANGAIYDALRQMWADSKPIDLVTLKMHLAQLGKLDGVGGLAYLVDLTESVPAVSHPEHYAIKIHDHYKSRATYELLMRTASSIIAGPHNIGETLTACGRAISDLIEQGAAPATGETNLVKIGQDVVMKLFDAIDNGEVKGLSTGMREVDTLLGGLHPGEYYIVAARPGAGKSSYATNIAMNVARQGYGVILFNLEMTAESIFCRVAASEMSIDCSKFRDHSLVTQEDRSKLIEFVSSMSRDNLHICVDDYAVATPEYMRSRIRDKVKAWKKEGVDLGLVVVDYLQLMPKSIHTSKGANKETELADISRWMKLLSKEFNVPMLVLSQLNRDVEKRDNKRPMLSDLRSTGSLEQDADAVMMLYRESYYEQKTGSNPAECIVAKNRHGSIGTANLVFNDKFTRFENPGESSATYAAGGH